MGTAWQWAKGTAIIVILCAAALGAWAVFLPASHPTLDRIGVLGPMRSLGLPIADSGNGAARGGPPFGGGDVRVVAQTVAQAEAGTRLGAIGTGLALRSVAVTSEVSGRLETVSVSSGDWVEAGMLIAQLDAESQRLALARAELALRDAQSRADRVAQLRASGSATQVQIDEAELALNRAQLDLQDAEFELRRRQITAPIAGWIGLVSLEPGDQVASGAELARLDDRSELLVEFSLPERVVGLVAVGDPLEVSPLSRPQDRIEGRIRAMDARVNQDTRTLRIQATIANDDDRLRPGMAFRIAVPLPGETYAVVDPLAIQWDRGGAFVWALDDEDRARRVGVEIVQRRDTAVLLRAALDTGAVVVLEGVQNLRPGAQVSVAEMRMPSHGSSDEADQKDMAQEPASANTTPDI